MSVAVPPAGTGSTTITQLTHLPLDSRYYSPAGLTAFGDRLYYLAPDTATTSPATLLWSTDGTAAGTTPVTTAGSHLTGGTDIVAVPGALYVTAGTTLYKTDGVATVTSLSLPTAGGQYTIMGTFGPRVILLQGFGTRYATAGAVWVSDGTVAGTVKLGRLHYAERRHRRWRLPGRRERRRDVLLQVRHHPLRVRRHCRRHAGRRHARPHGGRFQLRHIRVHGLLH